MRLMDLEALAPKPNTSRVAPEHTKYPYLLRNLKIDRVDQVWASDITYIPLAHGFAYLVAILDLYSRRVLAWRLSNTLDTSFCIEALQEALWGFGQPDIFNTDQGSQFTADAFTWVLLDRGVKVVLRDLDPNAGLHRHRRIRSQRSTMQLFDETQRAPTKYRLVTHFWGPVLRPRYTLR